MSKISYVYGPVISWRSGSSLGIDPIGETSTCSFNCSYCQLGQIQNISRERKIYVQTQAIINNLEELQLDFNSLDVITFAGSGEPSLALNLGEMIKAIKAWLKAKSYKDIPISILSNATLLEDEEVRKDFMEADLVSLKLDASDENSLKSINQAIQGLSLLNIINGIKKFKEEMKTAVNPAKLQLQIMFLPKFAADDSHLKRLADIIRDLNILNIQINTPTRAKPKSGDEYWIETRGNHYTNEREKEKYLELPIISEETAFALEEKLTSLIGKEGLKIINVYKRSS